VTLEQKHERARALVTTLRSWRGDVLDFSWKAQNGQAHAFCCSLHSDPDEGCWRWSVAVDGESRVEGVADGKGEARDAALDALAGVVGEIFWPDRERDASLKI
jgi:hypothetical protein